YDTEVLMLTAFGTIEKAVEAMKAGAYTYVTKGTDTEVLLMEIKRVTEMRKATKENKILKETNEILKEKLDEGYMLQSNSPKYNQLLMLAERAAASEANILIFGESGAGKEVLASFIHDKSNRKSGNFMELNCQALSESILESELFGHEKGAFTGASQKRIGLFEAANGGTLFLDEIGGVSVNLQAKLLKAIENKIIYRMGSSAPITVDFRLITATNRNLKEDMDNELFRSDLFYRLSTIVLELPPLRERKEDIPLFIDYFIAKYSKAMNKGNIYMDDKTRQLLMDYDYPGNVRELRNIIERLLVLSEHGEIKEEYLPSEILSGKKMDTADKLFETDYTDTLKEYRSKAEKKYIEELLEQYPNDLNKVSEILSISRRQLFNKLVEFGLK
ncbi:MAG: sigma-54-dependent Fis family transcriptional regulator, partial [Firmicutes bacterium]|nr:sigma-54-dependent Fis family transcriptional regulator [Bacillota bacterium]